MQTKTYSAGESILAEGTYGTETYLIKRGIVDICKEAGNGRRIQMAQLKEGEVFGEMCLLDDTGFRSASVVARTDVEVEVLSRPEMERHLEQTPEIVRSIMKTLSSRLAATTQEVSLLKYNRSWVSRLFG